MDCAVMVYKDVIPSLPSTEKWNLQDQLRFAVSSVPVKIAEGQGRHYYRKNAHFCDVARGSLTEVYSHVRLARRLSYIPADQSNELSDAIGELIRIINAYIAYLKRTKVGAGVPGAGLYVRDESAQYRTADPDEPFPSDAG